MSIASFILLWISAGVAYAQGPSSTPPGSVQHQAGVNYHATTSDFINSSFISQYHHPAVRATVVAQLQGMANGGAGLVKTTLWQVGSPTESWRLSFPLSTQELTNIENYVRDVAATRRPDGAYLNLQLSLAWLGCADYTLGSAATTIGYCGYTWAQFLSRAQTSLSTLIPRVASIQRADGRPAVAKLYLEIEVMVGAKANQDRFLTDLYPYFKGLAMTAGLDGSVYFNLAASEAEVLDNSYVDATFPALNGHRSLYWLYRSVNFMMATGLAIPDRLDFSFYPTIQNATYAHLVGRVFDDVSAVFPGRRAAVVETFYSADATRRSQLGQALAQSYLLRGMPEDSTFWSTPYSSVEPDAAPPFDFLSYSLLIPPGTTSSVTSGPVSCAGSPVSCATTVNWQATVAAATAALWLEPPGGSATLVGCGKAGQAAVTSLQPNIAYTFRFFATPLCDVAVPAPTGVQLGSATVMGCAISLSSTSATMPASGGSGSVAVTTGAQCAWAATPTEGWIRPAGGGPGSATVTYVVDPNTGAARSGGILIGGLLFRISQAAPSSCSYSLGSSSASFSASGGAGSLSVTAGAGCAWAATTPNPWIHTSSSGSGNGTVAYTVDPNVGAARTGSITVGGATVTVSQAAAACAYSLGAPGTSVAATGGSGSVTVTAGSWCAWSATTAASWIHTSSSGSGNGTVTFTVDANAGSERSGSISIAGQIFSIVQAAPTGSCSYAVSPANLSFAGSGGTDTVTVTAPAGCQWTATTSFSWIRTSGTGAGNGTLTVIVDPNPGSTRRGTVIVGGQTVDIKQMPKRK